VYKAKQAFLTACVLLLTGPALVRAQVIDHSGGFANQSDLTLNGGASIVGSVARLTPPDLFQAGTIFSNERVDITKFSNTFTFQIHDPAEADGITFIIQGNAPTALGGTGGGLGYATDGSGTGPVITQSVAIKFDLYDNQGEGINSTGLFTDGHPPTVGMTPPDESIDLTDTGIDLHSEDIFRVNMTYDGTTLTVTILDTQTLASASQSYAIDIPSFAGGKDAFVGFSGGTGALIATQDILTWLFTPSVATTFAWHGPYTIASGVTGTPSFVQARPGTYGTKGNYELVVPLESGGLAHYYRDNDQPGLPWHGPFTFGTLPGVVEAVSLIQSNFSSAGNGPGNLAVVARIGGDLVYYYRDDHTFVWHGPTVITTGVTGVPSFVQARPGTFGNKGNYELVVPLQTGGMAHFYRDNDDPSEPWKGPFTFGTERGLVEAVSLVQSNFSTHFAQTGTEGPGNLAVVARIGKTLAYFYRDDAAPYIWHGPIQIVTTGVTGNPSFVQAIPGTFGSKGNYELAVPVLNGGIVHFYRDNDNPSQPWIATAPFAKSLDAVAGVSLIQSNFSTVGNGPGNLAVASVAGNQLDYFYRDDE
jgi:hypothetical protein